MQAAAKQASAASLAAAVNLECFITVPEVTLPGGEVVPSFQVGQFAAGKGEDGGIIITADAKPWTGINYHESREACTKQGYTLITEKQWLAIAWNASQQDCNWTGGKVGEGDLFQGIRNWHVGSAQPGSYTPEDETERRWLTLSNGERICDLNGNVLQWVFDDVQGDENGIVAKPFAEDSLSVTVPPYPNREKGIGDHQCKGWDWSGLALVRGGCWLSGSYAGVFYLGYGWPGYRYDLVGFRCTKPI